MNVSPDSFDALEHKLDRLLAIMTSLRAENETLRLHVSTLENEKVALGKKIDIARAQLEALRDRLPTA